MKKAKRRKNIKDCPEAYRWAQAYPDAAENLRRVIKLMNENYNGDYQGYINRSSNYAEYRFDPVEDDLHFSHIRLFGRKKHTVVRLKFKPLTKTKTHQIGVIKTLKDRNGNDYKALDISISETQCLSDFSLFLNKTITFKKGKKLTSSAHQQAKIELNSPIDSEEDARERELRTIFLRRGQKKFRDVLLNAYEGKCAITGCTVKGVLEAAHILPYKGVDTNRCDNGLLLRADIHTLFDLGLLWIDQDMRVQMASTLRNTEYKTYQGKIIFQPKNKEFRPHPEHLKNHRSIIKC